MHRIATALGLLLLMSVPALAQKEFEPTATERKTIGDCIDKTAGDSELEQMSKCIGLIADPCVDAPNANTFTIVACNMREQTIWDDRLNDWYGQAQSQLKGDAGLQPRLKTRNAPGSNSAMRNAAIGRSVTRAAHSPQWQPETAPASRQDGAHSRCGPSSKISITRKRLTARGAGVSLRYPSAPPSRSSCCRSSFQSDFSAHLPGPLRPGRRQLCRSPPIA
jgi:hypothetical protein